MTKPKIIILDTAAAVDRFYEALLDHDIDLDINRLVEWTLEAMQYQTDPQEAHLDDLIDHFVRNYEGEARAIVSAVLAEFVNCLVARIKPLNLYDKQGEFTHPIHGWDGSCIVITQHPVAKMAELYDESSLPN